MKHFRLLVTLALAFCITSTCATSALCKTVYVNAARPNDTGDGLTWETAKQKVPPAASTELSAGDEVWVAAGSYSTVVSVKDGVALYGGFLGTETERDQRNWKVNVTTLLKGVTVSAPPTGGSTIDPRGRFHDQQWL